MIDCKLYQVHLKVEWDDGTTEMLTLNKTYTESSIPSDDGIARMIEKGRPIKLDDGRWVNPRHIRTYIINVWRLIWDWS